MSWLAASDGAIAARIPEVHGTSLSNEPVNLPEALQGKVGVLVLGFSRDSREADSAWGKRLAGVFDGGVLRDASAGGSSANATRIDSELDEVVCAGERTGSICRDSGE
jgi:hypothetical protein